ncbi:MAG: hypothetical protein RMJ56_07580 [Gemmataceae bacterium]|nr:hypothetical protein [Gemmata sp.]MDW8197451.1 hypothetical protein [Gemmataceae bacterium]
MVATIPRATSDETWSDEELAAVADSRARGQSWESIADQRHTTVAELRAAVRHSSRFAVYLAAAQRELLDEVEAEMLHTFQQQMRSAEPAHALRAAEAVAKYLAARRREQTRRELASSPAAKPHASPRGSSTIAPPATADPDAADAVDNGWTPEDRAHCEEVFRRNERIRAEQAVREKATVFLWGGCHPLQNVPPDETDTPLMLLKETFRERGDVYWAVTAPPPVDDINHGPFLPPPGCRPPTGPPPNRPSLKEPVSVAD